MQTNTEADRPTGDGHTSPPPGDGQTHRRRTHPGAGQTHRDGHTAHPQEPDRLTETGTHREQHLSDVTDERDEGREFSLGLNKLLKNT